MGTQNSRLTSDFAQGIADLGESCTLTHKLTQVLNPATGAFSEVSDSQTITAVASELTRKDFDVSPDRFRLGGQAFRFRDEDLTVSSISVGDLITYGTSTFKVLTADNLLGIWRIATERVDR